MPELTEAQKKVYLGNNGAFCPFCGGNMIDGGFCETGDGEACQRMTCECGESWDDVYKLVRIDY